MMNMNLLAVLTPPSIYNNKNKDKNRKPIIYRVLEKVLVRDKKSELILESVQGTLSNNQGVEEWNY